MQQFQQADNKPKLSHELVAGAAAYYAAGKYEEHCEANGKDTFVAYLPCHNEVGNIGSGRFARPKPASDWKS